VPVNTFDLDVVHSREAANIERLLAALESLEATYRMSPEAKLKAAASHLASPGHRLLITRLGPLYILGSIGRSRDYHDLLPHAREVQAGQELRVQVLNLETLIAVRKRLRVKRTWQCFRSCDARSNNSGDAGETSGPGFDHESLAVTDFQLARLQRGIP
jgi:hypothetical protein